MVRIVVVLVLCIGNAIPRGTAVCCAGGTIPQPTQREQRVRHSCCAARNATPPSAPGKHGSPGEDGKSCASPCCAKAPAAVSLLTVKPLEFTPIRAAVASYDTPETPTHEAIFHPPKA